MRWSGIVLMAVVTAAGAAPAHAAVIDRWEWPLAGPHAVTRPFAPPAFRYGVGHRGADLPGEPGAVVRAAGAGRVSYAGLLAGRGVVVVAHGALRTTYEPVDASVTVGDHVEAGAALGRLAPGHAGCPVQACLHWGLRRGDDYLDPVRLVDAPPLRLLAVGPPVAVPGLAGGAGDEARAADGAGGVDDTGLGAPEVAAPPPQDGRTPADRVSRSSGVPLVAAVAAGAAAPVLLAGAARAVRRRRGL